MYSLNHCHLLQATSIILLQVLIFSEKKSEVDDIHEYLLLKGVGAVSIHGGKGKCRQSGGMDYPLLTSSLYVLLLLLCPDQEERQWAVKEFRGNRKDVLVATDIASKGLDFPDIKHIVNYDMPADIENYGTGLWVGVVIGGAGHAW